MGRPLWTSGETIVLRYRSAVDGCFRSGRPLRVIDHSEERLVAYLPEATEVATPVLADGRGLRDVPLEERWAHPRRTIRRPWNDSDLVMIFPRARAHSLWVFRARGSVLGWYVNLEEPHVLGDRTISTEDAVLDIWVPAETGEPEWKDEDEFAAAIRAGRIAPEQAKRVRAEGERVLSERPWPTGWETWSPPADWTTPTLPPAWDVG